MIDVAAFIELFKQMSKDFQAISKRFESFSVQSKKERFLRSVKFDEKLERIDERKLEALHARFDSLERLSSVGTYPVIVNQRLGK
jgi:hypothetical protein